MGFDLTCQALLYTLLILGTDIYPAWRLSWRLLWRDISWWQDGIEAFKMKLSPLHLGLYVSKAQAETTPLQRRKLVCDSTILREGIPA